MDAIYTKYYGQSGPLTLRSKDEKEDEEEMEEQGNELEQDDDHQSRAGQNGAEMASKKAGDQSSIEWDKTYQNYFKTATLDQIREKAQVE